jgi:phosphatidylinositol alpha-1,6-mannosyltransferase
MAEKPVARAGVLLVTRNFPPLVGGMENVNLRLLQALAAVAPTALAGPAGSAMHAPEAVEVREAPVRPLFRFLLATTWNAARLARRRRPRLVLAGSGLAVPMAWLAARICGARLAVYLHGLDLIVPNRVYQSLWLPFIRSCDLALVNSRHTAGLAAAAGLEPARVFVLNPGTDVPALDPAAARAWREGLGLGEGPLLLSVGRLTRRKGLAEFVRECLPRIVAEVPEAILVVIGEEASEALHTAAGSERERIEGAARSAGVLDRVRFLGHCSAAELAAAYQAAQLHVFPVLEPKGDVEGFGMVALESAAHGLRTVAFAVGGVPDAIDPERSGTLVVPGDYPAFAGAVLALLASPASDASIFAGREFARGKDWTSFGRRLRILLGLEDAALG